MMIATYLNTKTILLLLLAPLLAFSLASCGDDDGGPTGEDELIPDAVLRNAILVELEKTSGPLTEADLLAVTELDVRDLPVITIEGIEKMTNLEHLNLHGTQVTDASPVAGLTKLKYLRFSSTNVSDISAVANLTNLEYFNINGQENITDISPLANATELRELILRDVPLGNAGMNTLANFTKLYRLNLRNTGVTDLSVLGELMSEGALQDNDGAGIEAEIDLQELVIPNTAGNDGWAPIRPYYNNISFRNPETLPAPEG